MAIGIQVAGAALIKVSFGGAYATLGYTRNGADVTLEGYFLDVPGDENGGDEGPPIDIQWLGEIGRVRLELTKFDMDVANQVSARLPGASPGVPYTAGTLLFGSRNDQALDLLVHSASYPLHFPIAIPRQPIESNKGTKFSTLVCEFECYRDSDDGVLWNNSISAH